MFYNYFYLLSSSIRRYRDNEKIDGKTVLYLNAGDTYTGTTWFYAYKAEIASAFMNILKPDAMVCALSRF